ncbi:hypothetical protein XBKB1_2530005 [Xenorhabdus bovienii str. kraussei Becker Underwood]|uniref:Uncharacterized protein n=1 Tax=Xenorhabdus bovienii str. kraussei Becker Underwood TaxID=1398204 RepID=A0A077PWJ2_XENBV|nr:hypothetical protein XBKB1_2530005 [Xenorhabdus bovienii str. kraussei Becker Underwood]
MTCDNNITGHFTKYFRKPHKSIFDTGLLKLLPLQWRYKHDR